MVRRRLNGYQLPVRTHLQYQGRHYRYVSERLLYNSRRAPCKPLQQKRCYSSRPDKDNSQDYHIRYNYSSETNGIKYDGCYVYTVYTVHNGSSKKWDKDSFSGKYSLRRPYNLYEAYWCTAEDYGVNAELSPNAWVSRLNADTETETKYNKGELDRIGYYTTNAAGEKVLDYRVLKRHMIWAHGDVSGKAECNDPTPWD